MCTVEMSRRSLGASLDIFYSKYLLGICQNPRIIRIPKLLLSTLRKFKALLPKSVCLASSKGLGASQTMCLDV